MNVLSLFDGMSCGRIALARAGVPVTSYTASEIEPWSMSVAQAHWPSIRQIGDVTGWRDWDIDWASIDLLIGGSPCQGFSSASHTQKGLDDPRSRLFWEFAAIRDHIRARNPNARFLLENVKMRAAWVKIITDTMGAAPLAINSSLISAQSRQRLYWTDIPGACVPEDRGVTMADIVEPGWWSTRDKSYCIDANYWKGGNFRRYFFKSSRQLVLEAGYDPRPGMTMENANEIMHRDGMRWRMLTPLECERLQTVPEGYTGITGLPAKARYHMLGNGWTVSAIAHLMATLAPATGSLAA